jgi:adenylate cyclase
MSILLPLFVEGEFTGALALGNKKSGHFYSREDVDLLTTVSWMTSTAIEEAREKGQRATLMQLFSKHVSPQVAESLWERRDEFLEGGRPRSQILTVTAMFTDLQGFSSVSEKLDPQTLMEWLNAFMERITEIVMMHGGVVDDFFGDGIKVNFGVPVPRRSEPEIAEDATRAVECALAIGDEIVRLNERMQERGLPMLRMRVGLCTGAVLAGSLGSADRLKYTTLGDPVNTAARLESYEKDLVLPELASSPARILIAESTLRHLGERFETRRVGEISLKGKEAKVTAYAVIGRRRAPYGPSSPRS